MLNFELNIFIQYFLIFVFKEIGLSEEDKVSDWFVVSTAGKERRSGRKGGAAKDTGVRKHSKCSFK
jgi:hypothetical protein